MDTKKCAFCNEEFVPNSNRQIYCNRPHYQICPVCGEQVQVTNVEKLKRPPVACSYACRVKRTQQTSMLKYGCKAPGNNEAARTKAKSTCLQNNGVEYAMQSKEVREKSKNTMLQRYHVENAANSPELLEKRHNTVMSRYGNQYPFNSKETYSKQHETMLARYGVPYYCMTDDCITAQGHIISKVNIAFKEKLEKVGLECTLEHKITNKSYDIHIANTNVLIEIDPSYTHSTVLTHWGTQVSSDYHLSKTTLAEENGYRCIHIFDWDNQDKILQMLQPKKPIYARKCEIWEITTTTTAEFLNKYHLQGTCRGQTLCLGLVQDGELYQIMTFGKSRYDKQHNIELLRLCTKAGYVVIGGAERLFSYATKYYSLEDIISYCDRSKFSGDVYRRLGMKQIRTSPPQGVWSRGTQKITANLLRQRGYDQLFNTQYGKGISNEQLMLEHGWLPVHDCGQTVFEY